MRQPIVFKIANSNGKQGFPIRCLCVKRDTLSEAVVTERTLRTNLSYQKTAIFPETREGNETSFNESARGWSLREANIR